MCDVDQIIRQSHVYHSVGKSRSVVLSSGAQAGVELRAPHDVANLGHLFNLNEQQAKNAVTKLACDAVKSGAGRRLGPFRAVVQAKPQLAPDEAWKIPSDPKAAAVDSSSSSDSEQEDTEMKVYE